MNADSPVKRAAEKLQSALTSLEAALSPLVEHVQALGDADQRAQSSEADRADLARQLDESKAREAQFAKREKEFQSLAKETTAELDGVISQVLKALGEQGA